MPSSSDEVATNPRKVPSFNLSSISLRCATATLPWCARTNTSPARSLIAPEIRSARRRLFTKIKVERCDFTSSRSCGCIALQIEGLFGPCEAGPLGISSTLSSCAMSWTGTSTRRSSRLGSLASTIVTSRWTGADEGASRSMINFSEDCPSPASFAACLETSTPPR